MTAATDVSATELGELFASGSLDPTEALDAVLDRAERLEPVLNAFRLIDADAARASARESAARWKTGEALGPLDGVPISVKDLLLAKGWPSLRGSRLIDREQPWPDDSPAVARMREAGSVIIGKTNTAEFGWKGVTDSPLAGVTRNPIDPDLTPGGSSGGAAAALRAGIGAIALATDGGGSIRNPSAFTGLCGLKPTFGMVPAWPPNPVGTLATTGAMARTVADVALAMQVITRPDARDWLALPHVERDWTALGACDLAGLRVAFSPRLGFATVDPEIADLVAAAVRLLADLGAEVEEVDPPLGDVQDIFDTHWHAGVFNGLGAAPEAALKLLDPGLDAFVEKGRAISLKTYLDAAEARRALGQAMREFHQRFDVLALPTVAVPAFPADRRAPPGIDLDALSAWSPFSYPFNLTHQPGLSVPCGLTAAGLPAGLQLVGDIGADTLLLRAGHVYETARGQLSIPLHPTLKERLR